MSTFVTSHNINNPTPGGIVDASFLSPSPLGADITAASTSTEYAAAQNTKTYAHLKALDSSTLTQNTESSFLGLDDTEPRSKTMTSTSSKNPATSDNTPLGSTLLKGFSSTIARLRPGAAVVLSLSKGSTKSISHNNSTVAIEELQKSGVLSTTLDSKSICIFVRLGRLSNFNERTVAHTKETPIVVLKDAPIQSLLDKYLEIYPDLKSEVFRVYHNSRVVQNLAQKIEETEFKPYDHIEISSFNPNYTEFRGVILSIFAALFFGVGFSMFILGFLIDDLIGRSLTVLFGFLIWFFACVAFFRGCAKINLLSQDYQPHVTQTWNNNQA